LSFTITQLINFLFGTIVIGLFLIFYAEVPTWHIVLLPIIIIITITFLLAVGSVLGFFTVFIRDIDNLLSHVILIFFFSTPIIWEGGRISSEYCFVVANKSIDIIVDSYRDVLMYHQISDFL